jgi:ribosome-associated protein
MFRERGFAEVRFMLICQELEIPDDELSYSFSRSGGPGGQNVNKVSSRVTLYFDVERCSALSDEQKAMIRSRLANRISKSGVLRVSSQKHRSQSANREEATLRFAALLADALAGREPRRPTKVPKREKAKRRIEKKRRSELKRIRGDRDFET